MSAPYVAPLGNTGRLPRIPPNWCTFPFTALAVYPDYVAIINLSHEYNYKLNFMSPYSEAPNI